MLQTANVNRVTDSLYSFIGDAGSVTAASLSELVQIDKGLAAAWLRSRADAGYLHRDEFGRYGTSCPWPRPGL